VGEFSQLVQIRGPKFLGVFTPTGHVVYKNEPPLKLINSPLESVVGKLFWETPWFTGTRGKPEEIKEAITKAANGIKHKQHLTIQLPTGTHHFDFSIHPVRDGRGKIISLKAQAIEIIGTGPSLSKREREMLVLTSHGKSAWEIGKILNVSTRTAEWHIANVTKKLGAMNRTHAVTLAIQYGLIPD
jgi:DNA-binding CsgD family transcriptional regulator